MSRLIQRLWQRVDDEFGQGLTEYALVLALVGVGVLTALSAFGAELVDHYRYIVDQFPSP